MNSMTHLSAALFAAASCALQGLAQTLDTSAFSHRMDVAFSGCGVGEAGALENFPALVVFDPAELEGFSYADFKSPSGADLRFADGLGAELPHEIDTWGAGSDGRSLVWVRVPEMHSNAVVSAFWGSPVHGAASYSGADNVWANGYAAVWHLNGADGGGGWRDSTDNAHTLAAAGKVAMATAAGAHGAGVAASFGDGAYLVTPDADALDGMSALTLEAWLLDTKNDAQARAVFSKRASSSAERCYTLFQFSGGRLFMDVPDSNSRKDFENSLTPLNTWTHAMVIFDGAYAPNSVVACFMDGALAAAKSASAGAVPEHPSPLCVGNMHAGNTLTWVGAIDEARISNVARSPDWAAATHATMAAPFAFASYSAVELNDSTLPVVVTLPAQISPAAATLRGYLVLDGGSDAYVTTYWGPEDGATDAAAWSNAIVRASAQPADSEFADVVAYGAGQPGATLKYARGYHVRHHVANSATNVWSPATHAFTTAGAPLLGAPAAAHIAGATDAAFSIRLEDNGASSNVTVRCRIGSAPGALDTLVHEWTGLGSAQDLACAAQNLALGATYYYAFDAAATMPDDPLHAVAVHSPTNALTLSGTVFWTAGAGADTGWGAPANWSSASVPGAAADAVIPAPGYPISAAEDHAIGALHFASGASALDLGGATLTARAFDLGGRAGGGSATLALANGALAVTAPNSAAIGYTANDTALTLHAGARLAVNGIYIGHSSNPGGHSHRNKLIIGAGAALESTGAVHIGNALNDYYYPDANELRVHPGGRLHANGINIGSNAGQPRNNRLIIDGGAATNAAALDLGMGRGQTSSVLIQNGGNLRNDGNLLIGNATANTAFTVTDGGHLDVGGNILIATAGDTTGNSSTLMVSNAAARVHGYLETSYKTGGHSNRVLIHEDAGYAATLEIAGSLRLGRASRDNLLQLQGGALTIGGALSTAADGGAFAVATNNQIRLSGATAKIRAATLHLRNQSVLSYELPRLGFDEIPLKTTTTATLTPDTTIEIDTNDFTGAARLLQSAALTLDLPDENFRVTARGGRPWKITITSEYMEIKVTQPATLLIIK